MISKYRSSFLRSQGRALPGLMLLIHALAALTLATKSSPSFAECPSEWRPGQGFPGISGAVFATTSWDPDGPGSQSPLLVVGGQFTIAGETQANKIAAWNGTTWLPLGAGLGGESAINVSALTVYQGELIAGGSFTTAGGVSVNHIASWNGTNWQPMGSGLGGVASLTTFNGELIAATYITGVGYCVARWDGANWSVVGGPGAAMDNTVYSLCVYNGELIAGGWFNTVGNVSASHIARWNGLTWAPLGTGMDYNGVLAMTVYHGDLIAGGVFNTAGDEIVNHIARWNGANWQAMGTGLSVGLDEGAPVSTLTVYNDNLIVGGDFTSVSGVSAKNIARWDGTNWHSLGPGLNGWVMALAVHNGELIAGGYFSAAGNVGTQHIARWNNEAWQSFSSGTNNSISAIAEFNSELIAGGSFGIIGGLIAPGIARWNGTIWQPLGTGAGGVQALTLYNGNLIAGGWFTSAGSVGANHVARWDGSNWHALGTGMGAMEYSGPPNVYAMTEFNGELVVGGDFYFAGQVVAPNIARWNGTSWQPMGTGMYGAVRALTVYNGELIAGGSFNNAGGVVTKAIARWNGMIWQTLGTGMGDGTGYPVVNALFVHDGELIVGGQFVNAGGVSANNIARWNGTLWQSVGTGTNGSVSALTEFNDDLIAGGSFTIAGGMSANSIASWNGTTWQPLGIGISTSISFGPYWWGAGPYVSSLKTFHDELIVGGVFFSAGSQTSAFWARWGPVCAGDMNCDVAVTPSDIPYFLEALLTPNQFTGCDIDRADMNADALTDGRDIQTFIDVLLVG